MLWPRSSSRALRADCFLGNRARLPILPINLPDLLPAALPRHRQPIRPRMPARHSVRITALILLRPRPHPLRRLLWAAPRLFPGGGRPRRGIWGGSRAANLRSSSRSHPRRDTLPRLLPLAIRMCPGRCISQLRQGSSRRHRTTLSTTVIISNPLLTTSLDGEMKMTMTAMMNSLKSEVSVIRRISRLRLRRRLLIHYISNIEVMV